MSFLCLAFPISGIDCLCHLLHLQQGSWFSTLAHCVLNAICKTAIEDMLDGLASPSGLNCKAVEIDQVLGYPPVLFHPEVLKKAGCSPKKQD